LQELPQCADAAIERAGRHGSPKPGAAVEHLVTRRQALVRTPQVPLDVLLAKIAWCTAGAVPPACEPQDGGSRRLEGRVLDLPSHPRKVQVSMITHGDPWPVLRHACHSPLAPHPCQLRSLQTEYSTTPLGLLTCKFAVASMPPEQEPRQWIFAQVAVTEQAWQPSVVNAASRTRGVRP